MNSKPKPTSSQTLLHQVESWTEDAVSHLSYIQDVLLKVLQTVKVHSKKRKLYRKDNSSRAKSEKN